ncbi:toll/interleukin-1 receptor domain-containing protein [Nitrospira sp. Nam80]
MVDVFFSYSHEDEAYRNKLEKHLSTLKRQGLIATWHDRRIVAGQTFDDEIDERLEKARIILLLVSSDFLASDYCSEREMSRALERHHKNEARVIPVIVHPCDWKNSQLGKLRATPRDGKPVSKYAHQDDAYMEIVDDLRSAIDNMDKCHEPVSIGQHPQSVSPGVKPFHRSSNLRIKRMFTDRDKDLFLSETFEYVSNYFEGSLNELKARNPEIETSFKREGSRFKATVYRHGVKQSFCRIWLSDRNSFGQGIAYSSDESGTSCNEMLSIENDGYTMTLEPSMRSHRHEMSPEGGAEHLWSMFIERLQ